MSGTPYALVSGHEPVREATKRELIVLTRRLERAALAAPPPAVAATMQDARYLTERTRAVYAALAAAGSPGRLFARDLQSWLAPGVVGVALSEDDPLVDEWTVVLPGADPVVMAATDLRLSGRADEDRCFAYAVSRDPEVVQVCGRLLGLP